MHQKNADAPATFILTPSNKNSLLTLCSTDFFSNQAKSNGQQGIYL